MKKIYVKAALAGAMAAVLIAACNDKNNPSGTDPNDPNGKGKDSVAVTGVMLDKTSLTLDWGDTATLTVTVNPTNATDKTVTWTSSDPTKVSVDANGKITVRGNEGNATITAAAGNQIARCVVTVLGVTSIALSQTALTLDLGKEATLTATVNPANALNKTVTWRSSDTATAAIDANGKLTVGSYGGSATITATAGNKTAACAITVNPRVVTITANGVSFDMMSVAGGVTTFGSTNVTLSRFSIGKYEVTEGLWNAVMGINSNYRYDYPAGVSWNNIVGTSGGVGYTEKGVDYYKDGFCYKLSVLANGGTLGSRHFRLPTEAEWEYAARGGQQTHGYTYSGSNTIANVAWYEGNCRGYQPVGSLAANELGLYDMSGNAFEWCSDWYGRTYPSGSSNPTGAASGDQRVYRGGSWYYAAARCSVAARMCTSPVSSTTSSPGETHADLGFRLVLTP